MENNTQEKEIKKSSSSKSRSKNDSSKAKALNKKGVEFYNTREYEKALAKYEAALQIKPNVALYLNNKGNTLRRLKRHEDALIDYEAALEIKPTKAVYLKNKGDVLYALERYDEALVAYEAALKTKPKDDIYLHDKAWTLHKLTRDEEALAVWEMVLKIKPKEADYWNGKGDVLYALGRYEKALTAYEAAIEHTFLEGTCHLLSKTGRVSIKPDRFVEGSSSRYTYRKKNNKKSIQSIYYNNKGAALYALKRYDEALIAYEAALKIKPNNSEYLNNKAQTLKELGREKEADECSQLANKKHESKATAKSGISDLKQDTTQLLAIPSSASPSPSHIQKLNDPLFSYEKEELLQEGETAEIKYNSGLTLQPNMDEENFYTSQAQNNKKSSVRESKGIDEESAPAPPSLQSSLLGAEMNITDEKNKIRRKLRFEYTSEYYADHGNEHLSRPGGSEKALEAFEAGLKLDSDNTSCQLGKAVTLQKLERYTEALAVYEMLLKVTPKNVTYLFYLLQKNEILRKLARYDEATVNYDDIILSFPKDKGLSFIKDTADAWHSIKQYEKALEAYRFVLKYKPKDAALHYKVGRSLGKLGRHEEALLASETALSLKPKDALYYNNIGCDLSALRRYQEALPVFEKASNLKPNDIRFLYNWGLTLRDLGRYADAKKRFEDALKKKEPKVKSAKYHTNKGNILYELERYEEALVAYEAALKIKPNDTEYLSNKTQVLEKLGRKKEAKEKEEVAIVKESESKSIEDMPSLERDKVQPPKAFAQVPTESTPPLSSPLTRDKKQKHTGKRSYDNLAGATKLSHPITPKKWETYLKKIRTTKTGHLSTAKNNCAELLDALVKGTVQHNFETAPTRPSSGTYSFEARTVERSYGKTQRKRYLTLEDSFISYLGDGLHRWLEPPHQTLMDLRDDTAPKEGKQIALDTVEQEGFAPTTVARVHLEATLQKLARENGGWALIGVGFSRLMPLPSDLEGSQSEAKRQLFKTPGHFCGVYVVTPEFNAEHGNKLKESHPSEFITFLEPQAIYPRTKERCIAHKPEELFDIATEDQEKISANTFDNHFSLLVLNSQLKMEARAKNKRPKVERPNISISPTSGQSPPLPEDIKAISTSTSPTQIITSVLTKPITPVKPQIIDPERLTPIPLSPVSMETAHIKDEKKHPSYSTAHNFFPPVPVSQTLQAFQQKLKQLCEDNGYTFSITRAQPNQLIVHFTALNSVLAGTDEIRTELVALTRLWQKLMTDTGISIKHTQLKPDWKNWSLTITADAAALNPVAKLLCTGSAAYLPSQAESNLMSDTPEVASCAIQ